MFSFEMSYRLSDVFSSAISVESTQKNSEIESLWVDKYKAIKESDNISICSIESPYYRNVARDIFKITCRAIVLKDFSVCADTSSDYIDTQMAYQ